MNKNHWASHPPEHWAPVLPVPSLTLAGVSLATQDCLGYHIPSLGWVVGEGCQEAFLEEVVLDLSPKMSAPQWEVMEGLQAGGP